MNKQQLFEVLERTDIQWTKFKHCSAMTGETYIEGVPVEVLKSYDTIVGVAVVCNDIGIIVLERGYYSTTSSQHISKWRNELGKTGLPVTRYRLEVWNGNRWTKEMNRYLHKMDYKPFINSVLEGGRR